MPPPTNEAACGQKQYSEDCTECCNTVHANGADVYDQAAQDCVCRADECGPVCGQSFCANPFVPPNGGDACDACMSNVLFGDGGVPVCTAEAEAKCQASADCVAAQACVVSQACRSKPSMFGP
jgi:hypothetical protein